MALVSGSLSARPQDFTAGPECSAPEARHIPCWKEVVETAHGRFMHHLELRDQSVIDDQVLDWLREAYANAD